MEHDRITIECNDWIACTELTAKFVSYTYLAHPLIPQLLIRIPYPLAYTTLILTKNAPGFKLNRSVKPMETN